MRVPRPARARRARDSRHSHRPAGAGEAIEICDWPVDIASRRVDIGNSGGPVPSQGRPSWAWTGERSSLDVATSGIEHRTLRSRRLNSLVESLNTISRRSDTGLKVEETRPIQSGQGRALKIDILPRIDLRLPTDRR